MKWKYGLGIEEFDRLLVEQSGCCAICQRQFMASPKEPAIDHCHSTGVVRGLLCQCCNRGLGLFGDSADRMEDAINYLRRAGGPP